jgi:hypothetical protein
MMLTLYARREPAALRPWLHGLSPELLPPDVALYESPHASPASFKGVYPFDYSGRPTRSSRTTTLNCYRWNLVWLEDLPQGSVLPPRATLPRGIVRKVVDRNGAKSPTCLAHLSR